MKKFLLTAALVLALVTSLTAGTMAYYTATIPTIESNVVTKTFSIEQSGSDSFKHALKIAPGDNVVYEIIVKNTGEVPAETTLAAALDVPESIPGVTVSVEPKTANSTPTLGTGTTDSHEATIGVTEGAKSQTYVVNVNWDRGEKWDHATTVGYMGKTIGLTVNINAVQTEAKEAHKGN